MTPLALPALLSHTLVAFTIEFDNQAEHRMPHRTTTAGSSGDGPWLVSLAMWSNCMRFVNSDGVRAGDLEKLARTPTNLNGMQRWGYITVAPDPADRALSRPKPPQSAWLIRATSKGRRAQEVWRPLFAEIEQRWHARFGKQEIERLRDLLRAIVAQLDPHLPDCLPILGYGLFSKLQSVQSLPREEDVTLAAQLAKVLLAFAIEFERESALSLAISANVLRVLDGQNARLRDLPLLTGVSKESIAMAMGILQKRGFVVQGKVVRDKTVRLTPSGLRAKDAYVNLFADIEARWNTRFGSATIAALRKSLEPIATAPSQPPYPDNWRAAVPKPATLPHYPMVLHRGGYPDGS